MNGAVAPCKLVKTNKKFYICSDGTHTHSCACNFCLEVNVEVRIGLLNQLASQKSFDVLQSEDVKLWVVSTRETMNSFMAAKE